MQLAGAFDPPIWILAMACWMAAAVSAFRRSERRKLLHTRTDLSTRNSHAVMASVFGAGTGIFADGFE